jgi:hypothetical protein
MKNAPHEKHGPDPILIPFFTLHFVISPAANRLKRLISADIHKRKKSSALRTDAGGQGLVK